MASAKEIRRLAKETLGIPKLPGSVAGDRGRARRPRHPRGDVDRLREVGDLPAGRRAARRSDDNCDAGLVEPKTDLERPFAVGAAVTHSEWGNGEVQRYDDNRVVVLFESVGYRTLDLELVEEKGLLEGA